MDNPPPSPPDKSASPHGHLLLSSLAEFWSVIEPLLQAAQPRTVCEIGVAEGEFTARLLKFCRRNACAYAGIDPALAESAIDQEASAAARFFKEPSLEALVELPAQDVYFLDGDHNYYTVINELRLIARPSVRWPLIFLHDVGWPWARRDQYCAPERIPLEFRHPYSTKLGVLPGRNEPGPGGFSGDASAYGYGAADHEGGPRNGVLTAVEDFLREPGGDDWRLLILPAVFGLGILYAPHKCSPEVGGRLEELASSLAPMKSMLARLEQNRIDLFLAHIGNVSELSGIHSQYGQLVEAYKGLSAHTGGLQQSHDVLSKQYGELREAYDRLSAHSAAVQERFDSLLKQYGELNAHSDSLLASYHDLRRHTDAVQKAHDELQRAAALAAGSGKQIRGRS